MLTKILCTSMKIAVLKMTYTGTIARPMGYGTAFMGIFVV